MAEPEPLADWGREFLERQAAGTEQAAAPAPRCYDCLTEDVAVKVTDELGFEHWFCAEDWAAEQEFHEKVMAMLADAPRALEQD